MGSLLLFLLAAAPVKVASPGLNYLGVEQAFGDALVDRFATQLGVHGGFKITTRSDIAQVLGLERQKRLMGCGNAGSCLSEIAAALGADAIVSGSLMKTGSGYTITLRLVRGTDGSEIAAATTRAKDEDELQDWLDAQSQALGAKLRAAFPGAAEAQAGEVSGSSRSGRTLPWVTGGASLLVAGGGALSFALGKSDAAALSKTTDLTRVDPLAQAGSFKESLGVGLMVAGGVGLAASVAYGLMGGEASARVSLAPLTGGGAMVGVQGVLP